MTTILISITKVKKINSSIDNLTIKWTEKKGIRITISTILEMMIWKESQTMMMLQSPKLQEESTTNNFINSSELNKTL